MLEGQGGMVSRSVIFWDVDTQADFMLSGGKLYVPGAGKLIPNLKRLTDAARQGRVFIIGDACTHAPDDPEFERFPPHCIRGTPGAELIPETRAENILVVPNLLGAAIPANLSEFQQVILEKQTLDVFDNPNTEKVLERGRRVALVRDAIETLNAEDGRKTIEELTSLGARLVTTQQALAALERTATRSA